MPTPLAQRELKFRATLKALLEQVGYRDGIGLLQWDIDGSNLVGKFADRDGSKAFEFTVNGEGIAYKPLTGIRQDAYLKGLSLVFLNRASNSSSAYLSGFRRNDRAGKKNCTSPTSYSCGDSCINKNKQCRIRDVKVRQASLALVKEGKFIKGQQQSQSITPQQLERRVTVEEDKIRNLNYERGVIVDSKTGEVLVNKGGQQTSVNFTPEETAKFKGNVITHNHPNIWDAPPSDPRSKGLSFSDMDIRAACVGEAAEVRAVSAGYTHSMKPPKEGWNAQFYNQKFAPAYQRNYNRTYNEMYSEIWRGTMTPEEAEVEFHHRVMERTARDTGMTYTRTERRQSQRRAA